MFRDNYERKIVKQKEEISKAIIQISLLAQIRRLDLLFNKGTEALKEYIAIVREKIIQIHNL